MTTAPRHHGPRGDGDGWVECAQGHRHWGRFGAAGLLLHRVAADSGDASRPRRQVLLQHRAAWSHHGDTWGLLGGARNSTEDAVTAAVREAGEEGGVEAADVEVHGRFEERHGMWTYTTVIATARDGATARATGGESIDVAWVDEDAVEEHPLHPGFALAWPALRRALAPLHVVVDAANVVGSRPDGWWRDRTQAARRLVEGCARLAARGLARDELPTGVALPALEHWWPRLTVVVEGAARVVADDADTAAVRVCAAPGSGDDTVVGVAGDVAAAGSPVLVVTADRDLRERCTRVGATVTGPRWLTGLVDSALG